MVTPAEVLLVTPHWNVTGGGRERYAAELVTAARRRGVTMTVMTMEHESRTTREIAAWRAHRPHAPVLALEALQGATHYQLHSGVLADSYAAEHRSFPTRLRRAGAGLGLRLNMHRQRRLRRERDVCANPVTQVMAFSRRDATAAGRRFGTPPDRLTIARPGIDLHRFSAPADKPASRQVRALFAGHNFQLKGLAVALQALARAGSDATLTIAGRDNPAFWRRQAARLGVADRVRFIGVADTGTMVSLYRESDVLLHPAVHDPFPRVILEALACGCPVITTRTCGASEILSPGKDGWVVDAADSIDAAGDIAAALAELNDSSVRRVMSARAAQTGRQFDFDAHANTVFAWLGMRRDA